MDERQNIVKNKDGKGLRRQTQERNIWRAVFSSYCEKRIQIKELINKNGVLAKNSVCTFEI